MIKSSDDILIKDILNSISVRMYVYDANSYFHFYENWIQDVINEYSQANDGVILYIFGMFMTFKGVTNYSDVQNDVV